MARTAIVIVSLLAACERASVQEATSQDVPHDAATGIAPPNLVGPFDISTNDIVLSRLFAADDIKFFPQWGQTKPEDTHPNDRITIFADQHTNKLRIVAEIDVRGGTDEIVTLRVFPWEDRDRVAARHPGFVCGRDATLPWITCRSDRYPDRIFVLDPSGTKVGSIEWTPPAARIVHARP